jgi:CDP-glucose 4,6-dehydratase
MTVDPDFWRGKRVLVTGHTGFKGGWLSLWLQQLRAQVFGLALPPVTSPNLCECARVTEGMKSILCDIRDASAVVRAIRVTQPEIIFHLAAQPLVRAGYREPLTTFSTNIMGSVHVLEALRELDSVRVVVMVTTDKVYENYEQYYPYRENDTLGGHDPYSASKAASEIVIDSYHKSYLREQGVAVASARAGNVIGGGDWSEDRLIPDALRAWQSGKPLRIRHPKATRPWQHVLEPLAGYLTLAKALWAEPDLSGAFNFGPHAHETATVKEVIELALRHYSSGKVLFEEDMQGPPEANGLTLDTAKVRNLLGIRPQWTLEEAIRRTMAWYEAQHEGRNVRILCEQDIADYEACQ